MKKYILLVALLLTAGCGDDYDNCQGKIDAMRQKYGQPEAIDKSTSSSGWTTIICMYYRQGKGFGYATDGKSCKYTESTFSPIINSVRAMFGLVSTAR